MCGNTEAAKAALKAAGNRLVAGVETLRGRERPGVNQAWACHRFARRAAEEAFSVLPIQDGPERLDPDAIRAMVPRLEGAADLVEALLAAGLCQR